MDIFHVALIVATFLCTLVAGFVFAFAVVVMPGIRTLGDGEFLRAFQVMDRVIQNNHPLFMLVWVGSILAVFATVIIGVATLSGSDRLLVVAAAFVYLAFVQLPTFVVNVPLNNRLQALDVAALDASGLDAARTAFEARWNRWNRFRTAAACVGTIMLLLVLARL